MSRIRNGTFLHRALSGCRKAVGLQLLAVLGWGRTSALQTSLKCCRWGAHSPSPQGSSHRSFLSSLDGPCFFFPSLGCALGQTIGKTRQSRKPCPGSSPAFQHIPSLLGRGEEAGSGVGWGTLQPHLRLWGGGMPSGLDPYRLTQTQPRLLAGGGWVGLFSVFCLFVRIKMHHVVLVVLRAELGQSGGGGGTTAFPGVTPKHRALATLGVAPQNQKT